VSVVPPSDPDATGPSCAFFGGATSHSPAGMLLARLILDELETEFHHKGRLRRLTGALLRETRMPAVQVEPSFPTPEGGTGREDEADPADRIALAIAAGIRRFFRGSEPGPEGPAST
jgi:N-acetylmuramoyl-L-alanine amidase